VDLGSVAVIALTRVSPAEPSVPALVGTVEGMLRQRQAIRGSATYGGRWSVRSTHVYVPTERFQGDAPFQRFSTIARNGFSRSAEDEAQRFNHSYIGPEHLLLVSRRSDGVAGPCSRVARSNSAKLRAAAESVIGRGETTVGKIDLSETTRSALSKARFESRKLGHSYIGTEHLLLGLIRGGGIPMAVLRALENRARPSSR